jgi:hypothetical protein
MQAGFRHSSLYEEIVHQMNYEQIAAYFAL